MIEKIISELIKLPLRIAQFGLLALLTSLVLEKMLAMGTVYVTFMQLLGGMFLIYLVMRFLFLIKNIWHNKF